MRNSHKPSLPLPPNTTKSGVRIGRYNRGPASPFWARFLERDILFYAFRWALDVGGVTSHRLVFTGYFLSFPGTRAFVRPAERPHLELSCSAPLRFWLCLKSLGRAFPRPPRGHRLEPPSGPPVRTSLREASRRIRHRRSYGVAGSPCPAHGVDVTTTPPSFTASQTRARRLAFGRRKYPTIDCSPKKKSIRSPRSRLADLPLPTPQVSACAPWLPKRSPASDSAASP